MSQLHHKLPTKLFETIERAGIATPKQILVKSTWDIKRITNLTSDDVRLLKNVAADCSEQVSLTGDLLLQRDTKLLRINLGCSALNDQLHGGLRRGSITELYGESGSGKTQVGIQAALHNWPSGTVYICTEDLFPVKRFEQMKKGLQSYCPETDYGSKVFVEHVTESHELLSCVRIRLPKLLNSSTISLIIIDSVAAPFRVEGTNYVQRAEDLRELGMHLIGAAQENNLAVLCINQVTASIEDGGNVIPSLGLAWSNMVNTRLWLKKTAKSISISSVPASDIPQLQAQVRELTVMFAPDVPYSTVQFLITCNGLQNFR